MWCYEVLNLCENPFEVTITYSQYFFQPYFQLQNEIGKVIFSLLNYCSCFHLLVGEPDEEESSDEHSINSFCCCHFYFQNDSE